MAVWLAQSVWLIEVYRLVSTFNENWKHKNLTQGSFQWTLQNKTKV